MSNLSLKGYKIEFTNSAAKELKKIDIKNQKKILSKLEELKQGNENADIKKLKGHPFYRLRINNYRIIFSVEHKIITITVVEVGHRKDVYERL